MPVRFFIVPTRGWSGILFTIFIRLGFQISIEFVFQIASIVTIEFEIISNARHNRLVRLPKDVDKKNTVTKKPGDASEDDSEAKHYYEISWKKNVALL